MRNSGFTVILAIAMAAGLLVADRSLAEDLPPSFSEDGESAASFFAPESLAADNHFDFWIQQGRPEYRGLGEPSEAGLRKCREDFGIEDGAPLTFEWAEPYHCFYWVDSKQFTALSLD